MNFPFDPSSAPPIQFVVVSDVLGGGERFVLDLAVALREHTSVGISGGDGSPVIEQARQLGIPTRVIRIGSKLGRATAARNLLRFPLAVRALRDEVRWSTDRGWCVLQYKWEELLWGGSPTPERVALIEHGPIPRPLLRMPPLRRRIARSFRAAGVFFVVSEPARGSVGQLVQRELVTLRGGVDQPSVEAAMRRRRETRAALNLADHDRLAVFVGRVVENKGPLPFVHALGEADGLTGAVIGDGDALPAVRRLAADLRLEERLRFVGRVDNALDYVAAGDVLVALSRDPGEGRPLVVLEALATGTPVVALRGEAMEALAEEAGGTAIELISDDAARTVRAAIATAIEHGRVQSVSRGWPAVARDFLDALAASGFESSAAL